MADDLLNLPGSARRLFANMVRRQVAMSALRVSLVVGTVLNIVNQGHALWQGEAADWPRLTLNFAVPFLVSSYSGARIFTAAAAEG